MFGALIRRSSTTVVPIGDETEHPVGPQDGATRQGPFTRHLEHGTQGSASVEETQGSSVVAGRERAELATVGNGRSRCCPRRPPALIGTVWPSSCGGPGHQGLQRSPAAHRASPPRSWCGCQWRASLSSGKVKFKIRGVSNINYNNKASPEHLNIHFCFQVNYNACF